MGAPQLHRTTREGFVGCITVPIRGVQVCYTLACVIFSRTSPLKLMYNDEAATRKGDPKRVQEQVSDPTRTITMYAKFAIH